MAKKKTHRASARVPKMHHKSMIITWIVLGALAVGLFAGFMFAKVKYMYRIDQISILFSQRDSKLNEMQAELNKIKSSDQQAAF